MQCGLNLIPGDFRYSHIEAGTDGLYVAAVGARNRHTLMKFNPDGDLAWSTSAREYTPKRGALLLHAHPSGGLFAAANKKLHRLDGDGQVLWTISTPGFVVAVDNDGFIYVSSSKKGRSSLTRLSPTGEEQWSSSWVDSHVKTLDPFRGVTWRGEGVGGGGVVVDAAAVYLVGGYLNTYDTSGEQLAEQTRLRVLALNREDGSFRWARQYRLDPPAPPDVGVKFTPDRVLLDHRGNLVIQAREGRGYPVNGLWSPSDISKRYLTVVVDGRDG